MSSVLRPTSLPSGILIHPTVWPQQTWAENWGLCPFGGGGLETHLRQYGHGRVLPPCQVDPSNRLATIHQCHRQTDRQDRQDTAVRQHRANRFTNGRPKTKTENTRQPLSIETTTKKRNNILRLRFRQRGYTLSAIKHSILTAIYNSALLIQL